jgi:predicted DsbA family dithiol-disulfide isomerase
MTDTTHLSNPTASIQPVPVRIDFVSDVSCPWCAVGLGSLDKALASLGPAVQAEIHFQPFELNPQMPKGGQDIGEHLTQKYGSTLAQQEAIRDAIRQRGADVGFSFRMEGRSRIYNTFNAHRLLHWAEVEGQSGQQVALKKALLKAYFTDGKSPEDAQCLLDACKEAGLPEARAQAVLASDEFTQEVRATQKLYLDAGIHSVPAVILNQKYLVSGGQPPEAFEQAIRQAAQL